MKLLRDQPAEQQRAFAPHKFGKFTVVEPYHRLIHGEPLAKPLPDSPLRSFCWALLSSNEFLFID